jgi:hypothetical protein
VPCVAVGGACKVPLPDSVQDVLDGIVTPACVVTELRERIFMRKTSMAVSAGRRKS